MDAPKVAKPFKVGNNVMQLSAGREIKVKIIQKPIQMNKENTSKSAIQPDLTGSLLLSPVRIQRSRQRGFKMTKNTIYVGRGSKFGNPFKIDDGFIVYNQTIDPECYMTKKING